MTSRDEGHRHSTVMETPIPNNQLVVARGAWMDKIVPNSWTYHMNSKRELPDILDKIDEDTKTVVLLLGQDDLQCRQDCWDFEKLLNNFVRKHSQMEHLWIYTAIPIQRTEHERLLHVEIQQKKMMDIPQSCRVFYTAHELVTQKGAFDDSGFLSSLGYRFIRKDFNSKGLQIEFWPRLMSPIGDSSATVTREASTPQQQANLPPWDLRWDIRSLKESRLRSQEPKSQERTLHPRASSSLSSNMPQEGTLACNNTGVSCTELASPPSGSGHSNMGQISPPQSQVSFGTICHYNTSQHRSIAAPQLNISSMNLNTNVHNWNSQVTTFQQGSLTLPLWQYPPSIQLPTRFPSTCYEKREENPPGYLDAVLARPIKALKRSASTAISMVEHKRQARHDSASSLGHINPPVSSSASTWNPPSGSSASMQHDVIHIDSESSTDSDVFIIDTVQQTSKCYPDKYSNESATGLDIMTLPTTSRSQKATDDKIKTRYSADSVQLPRDREPNSCQEPREQRTKCPAKKDDDLPQPLDKQKTSKASMEAATATTLAVTPPLPYTPSSSAAVPAQERSLPDSTQPEMATSALRRASSTNTSMRQSKMIYPRRKPVKRVMMKKTSESDHKSSQKSTRKSVHTKSEPSAKELSSSDSDSSSEDSSSSDSDCSSQDSSSSESDSSSQDSSSSDSDSSSQDSSSSDSDFSPGKTSSDGSSSADVLSLKADSDFDSLDTDSKASPPCEYGSRSQERRLEDCDSLSLDSLSSGSVFQCPESTQDKEDMDD